MCFRLISFYFYQNINNIIDWFKTFIMQESFIKWVKYWKNDLIEKTKYTF